MTSRWLELILGPFRASWRAGVGWALMFALFIVSTVAFWPAFKDASGLTDAFKQLPPSLLEAFGLQDFSSPAGYLRGGLYEVLIPLMFAAAAVMFANAAMSSEEDAGRLELLVAQPVTRAAVFAGRAMAVVGWLVVLTLVVAVSQLASDGPFGLEIANDRIVPTIVLCGLLGLFFGGLGLAIAGATARPGLVLGVGLGLALVGYLVSALLPLSDTLAPFSQISPWDWALGGDPLVRPTEAWRYAALGIPAILMAAIGAIAFDRRDLRSA